MKANKAPEKIYLSAIDLEEVGHLLTASNDRDDVEYTRTDAFIDRATDWLNNFYNEDTHSYLIDEDIEKFINYMKGK